MKKGILVVVGLMLMVTTTYAAPSLLFDDHKGHKWESGVEYNFNRGIVEGYPDGSFRPDQTLNRAELIKIIVESKFEEYQWNDYETDPCFTDLDGTLWYNGYVCFAKAQGIVEGYPDGSFKPAQKVNFVEALKIMEIGLTLDLTSSIDDPWYQMYYDTAKDKYLIPDELEGDYFAEFTRAQATEVIMRILSLDADIVATPFYQDEGGYEPGFVYYGYMQEGDVLDLYIVADEEIEEFSLLDVSIPIGKNLINEFRPDNITADYGETYVTITSPTVVRTNEVLHIGTAYLDTSEDVEILTDVM